MHPPTLSTSIIVGLKWKAVLYMLARTAAPPNKAPIPIAAVWTGPWFLVADIALEEAEEALLEAELVAAAAALEALMLIELSSEDKELAAEPVAVASSELTDEARLAASEVMDERRDETSLETEETALDRAEVADDSTLETLLAMLAAEEAEEEAELIALLSVEEADWACGVVRLSFLSWHGLCRWVSTYQGRRGEGEEDSRGTHFGWYMACELRYWVICRQDRTES